MSRAGSTRTGGFGWKPEQEADWEWLTRRIGESPGRPIRFYLDVGELETVPQFGTGPSAREANRHLRDVLRAKGYAVHYAEFPGGHDFIWWRGTLADGLRALLAGQKP